MTPVSSIITHRTVPLSDLRLEAPLWSNPRQFSGLEDKRIEELGESIKTKGINDPLKVQRILINGDVVDLVIDGQRRALAAYEVFGKTSKHPIPVVDIEEEPCELTPEKGDELLLKALTTLEREGLSSYELSSVAERMKNRGKTGEYIASALGKSASWVSKILKARSTASPKLMLKWRKGDITDEQFKDLAEVKDEEKQAELAKEVVDARKSGDKGEARMRSKEVAETAKKDKPNGKSNGVHTPTVINGHSKKPVVSGPQLPLIKEEPKPVKRSVPSRVALEEMVNLTEKRPPVSDYVKGVMDGVRYALGLVEPKDFAKSWAQYLSRIDGQARPAKKAAKVKRAAAAKVKKATKARKPVKAKTSTGKRKR